MSSSRPDGPYRIEPWSPRSLGSLLVLALAGLVPGARADVTPHSVFGDDMVLQRDRTLPVWGTAAAGEEVSVTLVVRPAPGEEHSEVQTTTADRRGRWRVEFAPQAAAPDGELRFQGENGIRFENVAIGDVWLCAGQSNMEMPVNKLRRGGQRRRVAKGANHANLRLFSVPNRSCRLPQRRFGSSKREEEGVWQPCTPNSVLGFSAVSYLFGRDLLQRDVEVPIGLISADCGGSTCEAWMSRTALTELGLQHYLDPIAAWDAELERERRERERAAAAAKGDSDRPSGAAPGPGPGPELPTEPSSGGPMQRMPTALFNGMIAPLSPFQIRGVVWYQGEGNAIRAKEYRRLLPALISDWRRQWGDELPFLVVQIAPYGGEGADDVSGAELRDAQFQASRMLPKVGLVVTTDLGEEREVHPQRKQPVGARLALAARAIAYGEDVEYSGPAFEALVIEGDRAVLSFEHAGSGLVCRGERLTGFTVCGEDRAFHAARAEIRGEQVIVTCDVVPEPVAVRFGWTSFAKPELNFFNGAGLPAVPFRTDDFALTTE